ncbi:MAG TPA: OmpA family protein, partial [Saprospiraceae bacterium]|nr:OmpA family protein [Saprospiraceae bacterium]
VTGHTDKTAGASYNKMLSYNRSKAAIDYLVNKYGIARNRFVLTYSGKEDTLIDTQAANYMNRRVEFRVAKPGDVEMPKPSGPNAGSGKFEGSRDAGY